jgi:hypothetical protein
VLPWPATPEQRLGTARHETSPSVGGRDGYINTIFLISSVSWRAVACLMQTSHRQERQNIEGVVRVRFSRNDDHYRQVREADPPVPDPNLGRFQPAASRREIRPTLQAKACF